MNYTDLSKVCVLSGRLALIEESIRRAAEATIMVNGVVIPDDLKTQLMNVGVPVVEAYYQSARDAIVHQLSALGVTV